MNDHVCTAKISKELYELTNIDSKLDMYWDMCGRNPELIESPPIWEGGYVPAYSVYELGEIMALHMSRLRVRVSPFNNTWTISAIHNHEDCHNEVANTEADARGKMAIWLIEKGHIRVSDITGKIK